MLHPNTLSPEVYWKTRPNQQDHLELWHRYPDTFCRARYSAKPDRIIHVNCAGVRTHVSCKTTRRQESFNYQGTKMFLFSDKLWLTTNNPKRFVSQYNKITCLCILWLCYNFNPLQPGVDFLYPMKTLRFSDVFRRYSFLMF